MKVPLGSFRNSLEELAEIRVMLIELDKSDRSEYQRGFLEGRAFEITRELDIHPSWWEGHSCFCRECAY